MANGYRMSKTVNGTTTKYLWDGSNIGVELNSSNAVTDTYTRGHQLICDKANNYYLHDLHGNVAQVFSGSSTVSKNNYSYNAFGTTDYFGDTDTPNKWGYCDQLIDEETGYYYLRARYYNPATGSFISEDPIKDGVNWYAYCAGNPILLIDLTGLKDYIYTSNEDYYIENDLGIFDFFHEDRYFAEIDGKRY